jgi:hypothetical protein
VVNVSIFACLIDEPADEDIFGIDLDGFLLVFAGGSREKSACQSENQNKSARNCSIHDAPPVLIPLDRRCILHAVLFLTNLIHWECSTSRV